MHKILDTFGKFALTMLYLSKFNHLFHFFSYTIFNFLYSQIIMISGFIFGNSHWLYDAPFDRYTPFVFHGEEMYLALRY
jgi:hypothetical protein